MKINFITPFYISVVLLMMYSCHWKAEIVAVKNTTTDSLLVARQLNEKMDDNILYNESFYEDFISPKITYTITLPDRVLRRAPDSDKIYIYIFNIDTVNKYQRLKKVNGIVKQSLLKKVVIQLNKVRPPLDTIYIGNFRQ